MCKFSSKSGGVPFQPLGDLTWNDPAERSIQVFFFGGGGIKKKLFAY